MIKAMVQRLRSREGFTLVEVAISMGLILFILQGIAMVSLYAQRSAIHARRMTSATILAEQLMERYRNKDYDNLAAFVGAAPADECFDVDMKGPDEGVTCGSTDAVFTRSTTVAIDPGGLANVLLVDVTTTWEESWAWSAHQETGTQQAKLVSYVSKF